MEYNSGKIKSRPGDFLGFRCLRAAASFSGAKGPEILFPPGFWTFHGSDSFLLVDLWLAFLCAWFFTSCEVMEFAEMGHRWEDRPDLPVRLLMVLHALRLECEKSMELTASSQCSCFFCSIQESRDKLALSESVPTGARMKIEGLALFVPTWHILHATATWDILFSCI